MVPKNEVLGHLEVASESIEEGNDDWVTHIRRGDHSIFESLVRTYGVPLGRFAVEMGCSRDEAEDVVQDVMVRLWERRDTWTPRSSVRAYLFGAVRNRVLNLRRHARVRSRNAELLRITVTLDADAECVSDSASSDERVEATVRAAFGALTERQVEAVRLRYQHRLRYHEIATVLGISQSGAEQLVARAVRALRNAAHRALSFDGTAMPLCDSASRVS